VLDTTTGQTIITLVSCTLASKSSGLQAGQLVSQRYSFRALATQ
jgi:hypothetical protein